MTKTSATFRLRGMSCAACANSIEEAIRSVAGVSESSVNFATEQASVNYDPQKTDVTAIEKAVDAAGYSAFLLQDPFAADDDVERRSQRAQTRDLTRKVWTGAIISAVVVLGSIPAMTGLHIAFIPMWLHDFWLQAVLTAPVQFWCGKSFYVNAWKALKRHNATMDTLIALGTSAAYFYSLFITFFPKFLTDQGLAPSVYYESASVVITLLLLGRLLENRAKGQTSNAIRKLMGLQAKTARIVRDGKELDIPIAQVRVGDVADSKLVCVQKICPCLCH